MPLTMSAMATPSRSARPARLAGDAHEPGFGLYHRVVPRLIAPRPGLAEAGDRGIDHARPSGRDRLVAESQTVHRAGTEVLHEHVRPIEQLLENPARLRLLQIERQALLVPVDAEEVRTFFADERRSPPARVVPAAGLLDLDDPRAHVGEQHRAVQARTARASDRRRAGRAAVAWNRSSESGAGVPAGDTQG